MSLKFKVQDLKFKVSKMKTYLLIILYIILCMAGACLPAYNQSGVSNIQYVAEITDPSGRVLDTNLAVGSIAGAADVSPTGGAVYNIPIALPEGVGSMTPQLAVTYNSQGGNGTMGIGWNLAGLSVIARTGRTIYHDGVAGAMELQNDGTNDRLMLDGQRLISITNGLPGLGASEYRSENETYATIKKEGSSYVVTTKDGRTIEYGKTAEARSHPDGLNGYTVAWWISKVTDPYGNFISYTYQQNTNKGEQYIQKIEYGSRDGAVCSVIFGYEKRDDIWKASVRHRKDVMSQTVLLKHVTIDVGNQCVGKYVFNYSLTNGLSKLVEIKHENGIGEQLNSTFFTWKGPTVNLDATQTYPCGFETGSEYIPVDFDGDGITDLLKVPKNDNKWVLYRGSSGSPQFCTIATTYNMTLLPHFDNESPLDYQIAQLCRYGSWPSDRVQEVITVLNKAYAYSVGDFDGDGVIELAVMTRKYNLNSTDICNYLSGQSNSFFPNILDVRNNVVTLYKYANGTAEQIAQKVFPGNYDIKFAKYGMDFNRNGKAELIVDNKIYEYNNNDFDEIGTTNEYRNFENAQWGDFNGDGRLDFVASDGKKVYTQISDNYNFSLYTTLANHLLAVVDINNDGISEFLMTDLNDPEYGYTRDPNGDYVYNYRTYKYVYCPPAYYNDPGYNPFYPNHPTSSDRFRGEYRGYKLFLADLEGTVIAQLGNFPITYTPTHAIVADIDGDGTPDLLVCRRSVNGNDIYVEQILYQFRAQSEGTGYTWLTKNRSFNINPVMPGDYDGDGITELVTTSGGAWKFASGNPGQLLASVTSGYNQKTLFEYAPLTTGIYTKGNSTWPAASLSGSVQVVKTIKQDNGLAAQTIINYSYTDGKIDLRGKGFLGFTGIKANNTTLGVETQISNTFDLTRGVLSKTATATTRGGKTAETTNTFTIADVNVASRRIRMYLGERKEKDINGNTVTTIYTVDTNGNITKEVTDYGGLTTTVNYSGYTTMGYPQTVESVQKHPDDNASFTNKTTYQYNDKGRATQKTENYGTDKALTTVYAYDIYGSLETSTLSYSYSGAAKSVVEKYVYDPTKRFVKEHHVTVGSVTEKTFTTPDIMGRTTEQTDANGQTIKYEYDHWGRLKITKYPGNLTETNAISWAATRDGYYTVSQATGKADVRTEYDLAGREKLSNTKGIGNTDITASHTYNTLGQLTKTVSATGDLSQTTTYEYYTDGRIKKETTGNNVTEYIYNAGRETEVKYNGKSTKKKLDGWGNVTETTDQLGNKVVYTYYSSGLPKNISAAGANYGMEYDAVGNQTKLTDPNAGAIRYTYDVLGRPETQTDAKGYQRKTEYDDWGRVAKVTLRDTTTRYTYFTTGSGKGQLQKVAELVGSTERHSIAWEYDELGRPKNETRKVAGVTGDLETSYTYDGNGNIFTVTYPGSVTETRGYDSYSNLTSVKAGGTIVWSFTSTTGKTTKCQLGNMSTETVYDNNGLLEALKTNSGNVRNFAYTFNPATGNLSQRTGMNGTESFTYDDLSRLKTAGAMSISYLSNGNIDTKTGLGKYGYGENGAGPHAVSSIVNTAGLVSDQVQQISYTAFHKAKTITETKDGKDYRLEIDYGPDHQRVKTDLKENGNVIKTVIFADNYERVTRSDTVTHLYYIAGGEGLCGIYVKQTKGNNTLKDAVYYVHPDHLGSLAIITDANGNVKQKCTYDAWGRRTFVTKDRSLIFDRGFTGHEHLEEFALVNMNGRMYDPTLGRFLSPDPYVQNPLFSQSFNRYAYGFNNPLVFTDPDGELAWFVPVIIGAAIGGFSGYKIGKAHGASGWNMAGYIFGGAVIGGVAGYAGAAVYTASTGLIAGAGGFAAGFNAGMLSGMVAGAINGAGMAMLSGGNFSNVMASMTMGAWFGGVVGGIAGGITEGITNLSARYQLANRGPEGLWAMVDNPGQCWDLGDDLLQYRYSIPEVTITARMPLHLTSIAKSIYAGQSAFWNHPVTRATTTVLTSMVGGGIISGTKLFSSAGKAVNSGWRSITNGGKTFNQYKDAYWATRVKPTLEPIINPQTGQVWKQYIELHHRFIPQRATWAPNWLKNNFLNLKPVSSLRHAQIDPYRARFAPRWIKETYNLTWR